MEIILLCVMLLLQAFMLHLAYAYRGMFLFLFSFFAGMANMFMLITDRFVIQYVEPTVVVEVQTNGMFAIVPMLLMTISMYGAVSLREKLEQPKEASD